MGFAAARLADVETDLLFVPLFEGEDGAGVVAGLDEGTRTRVAGAIASREIQGKPYELFITPIEDGAKSDRLALIGAGKPADYSTERLRRVATAAALSARQRRIKRLAFAHRGEDEPVAEQNVDLIPHVE